MQHKRLGRPPKRLTFEDLPQVPTVQQVASFLGVNQNTIYEQIKRGQFPAAISIGRRRIISKAKLAEWMGIPYGREVRV